MKKFAKLISLISVLTICATLLACSRFSAPQKVEDGFSIMQEKGYLVTVLQEGEMQGNAISGIVAYSFETQQGMIALWFETQQEASEFVATWTDDKYSIIKAEGVCAYAGTELAIQDFLN